MLPDGMVEVVIAIADLPDANGMIHTVESLELMADGIRWIYRQECRVLLWRGLAKEVHILGGAKKRCLNVTK